MAIKPLFDATKLPAADQTEFYSKLAAWYKQSVDAKAATVVELALRKELCDKYFDTPRVGVNKAVLGNGRMLEMDFRINRKIDEAALDAAIKGQTIDPDIITKVVKYKPDIIAAGWTALDKETRLLFADIVTEAPGTAGLKIVTPAA